jgi:hypothetical protein
MLPAFAAALLSSFSSMAPVARRAVLAAVAPVPVTLKSLQNFTYDFGDDADVEGGKVPLADGKWTDKESGNTYTLHPLHALGDLNGDGVADGVAFIIESSGGTGSFYYLFAIGAGATAPVQFGEPQWLGDRTVVQRATIDRRGIISVRYVTHAPGDAACCPTMTIEDKFRVEDGRLVGITK